MLVELSAQQPRGFHLCICFLDLCYVPRGQLIGLSLGVSLFCFVPTCPFQPLFVSSHFPPFRISCTLPGAEGGVTELLLHAQVVKRSPHDSFGASVFLARDYACSASAPRGVASYICSPCIVLCVAARHGAGSHAPLGFLVGLLGSLG